MQFSDGLKNIYQPTEYCCWISELLKLTLEIGFP